MNTKVPIVSFFNHHFPNEKSFLRSTKKTLNILKDDASLKSCPFFLLSTSDDNVARVLGTICAYHSTVSQIEKYKKNEKNILIPCKARKMIIRKSERQEKCCLLSLTGMLKTRGTSTKY